jgi:hypothetical protein
MTLKELKEAINFLKNDEQKREAIVYDSYMEEFFTFDLAINGGNRISTEELPIGYPMLIIEPMYEDPDEVPIGLTEDLEKIEESNLV